MTYYFEDRRILCQDNLKDADDVWRYWLAVQEYGGKFFAIADGTHLRHPHPFDTQEEAISWVLLMEASGTPILLKKAQS